MNNQRRPSHMIRTGIASVLVLPLLLSLPVIAEATASGSRTPAANSAQANSRAAKALQMRRVRSALPQSQAIKSRPVTRSLRAVKPPRTSDFYDTGSKEAEYEKLVDEEISALYKLSQQNRRSQSRGELWLRLGERYAEKARLIEFRAQAEYDKKLQDYHNKKSRIRPKLDRRAQREYNQKAVQLYEWFVKDFPRDSKVDQALFFLGYNHFELGNPKLGEQYYSDLIRRFPNSIYVSESRFALGEYYFENEQWKQALEQYLKVVRMKKARLNVFAMYKSAWCLYRINQIQTGLKFLDRVIRMSRAADAAEAVAGRRAINKVRLGTEAMRDYAPFYAEVGDPKLAVREFSRVTAGNEQQTIQMLERLAYIYADSGLRDSANYVFKQLISLNPSSEKAAEYQYQVVLAYATSKQKEFRDELTIWLESFGPNSFWARENAKNQKLVEDVAKLQETTLRNHVLQMHQAAQNSRAPYSQKLASSGYAQYLKYFPNSPQTTEMQFFYGELLFDMGHHEEAAKVYTYVFEKDPKGPYREKAVTNAVLALEKDLPDPRAIEERRGKSLEKMPLDPSVQRFEQAAIRYTQAYPKGEKAADIQRRLGVLYYSYNHFDEAVAVFEQIVRNDPKSENAEIAGNLILDIYKLKNDMIGFTDKGQQLLAIPAIASSKFGGKVREMLQTASYMRAEKIAETGDSLKAAKEFETYSASYKQSDLVGAARYNAAVNYEKAGDFASAIRMHNHVLASAASNPKIKAAQNDSRNALARIYQQIGLLDLAAKQYDSYASANRNDQQAINAYYNAGVLWEGLGETNAAINSYQAYFDLSKKSDRSEVLFSQAEMLRKRNSITRASTLYDSYLRAGPRDQAKAVQSAFYIAQIAEQKNQNGVARQWYQKTIDMYKGAVQKGKEGSVRFAAEARFRLAQSTLSQLMSVQFGRSDKQQAQAAAQVNQLREKYIKEMKEVILFDNADFIVAALASSGQMFDSLATLFTRIPVPNGFTDEDAKKYKELIQVQIDGFKKEAKNSYKAALDKSQELEAYNSWTRVAQEGLFAVDPTAGTAAGEIPSNARAADWMGL